MSDSSIHIERLPLEFVATTTLEHSELLERRLRHAVVDALPHVVGSVCERSLNERDDYVFIERLDVQCAVNSDWSDESIGKAFGTELAQALLRHAMQGERVAFRDREEYLASFMIALVGGHGCSHWWFAEFEGLALLPTSAALRTLIINEPAIALRALARLTVESLFDVVAVLMPVDVQRVLAEAVLDTSSVSVPAADVNAVPPLDVEAIWQALDSLIAIRGSQDPRGSQGPYRILLTLVALERARMGSGTSVRPELVRWIAALKSGASRGAFSTRGVETSDPERLLIEWSAMIGERATNVSALSAEDRRRLVDRLLSVAAVAAERGVVTEGSPEFVFTPYGGALILCALLVRLGWWEKWPRRRAARRALAVVAAALSGKNAAAIARDPLLRAVCGVEPTTKRAASDLSRDLRSPRVRAEARALLRALASCVVGGAGSSADYIRKQYLTLHASVSITEVQVAVRLGRAPLDVMLVLAGLKRADVTLPDGRSLVLRPED